GIVRIGDDEAVGHDAKKARTESVRALEGEASAWDGTLLLLAAALAVADSLVVLDLVGGAELFLEDRLRLLVDVAPVIEHLELLDEALLLHLSRALVLVAKLARRVGEVLLAVVARGRAGVVPRVDDQALVRRIRVALAARDHGRSLGG